MRFIVLVYRSPSNLIYYLSLLKVWSLAAVHVPPFWQGSPRQGSMQVVHNYWSTLQRNYHNRSVHDSYIVDA